MLWLCLRKRALGTGTPERKPRLPPLAWELFSFHSCFGSFSVAQWFFNQMLPTRYYHWLNYYHYHLFLSHALQLNNVIIIFTLVT